METNENMNCFDAHQQMLNDENEFFDAVQKYMSKYQSMISGIIISTNPNDETIISFNFDGKARRKYAENLQAEIELAKNIV